MSEYEIHIQYSLTSENIDNSAKETYLIIGFNHNQKIYYLKDNEVMILFNN